MSDRGMKKWNAYKALPEQFASLEATEKNHDKISKPYISNEEAENINNILVNYHGQKLIITIYKDGELIKIEKDIKKIDPVFKKIIFTDRTSLDIREIVYLDEAFDFE